VALSTVEAWLGKAVERDAGPEELVLRYLAAFGPAAVADVRTWSRLTGLRAVVERLRPRLRTFRDERGRELLDVPDAPMPDPDSPAPPRFLPRFDNALLSHDDRTRIVSEEHRRRLTAEGGLGSVGTLLVDGFVAGTWKTERTRDGTELSVRPFEGLSREDRDALADEGERLVRFLAGPEDADASWVAFAATP
jgi:hypothetical protein